MARLLQRLAVVHPRGDEFEAEVWDNGRVKVVADTLRPGPPTRWLLTELEDQVTDLINDHAHEFGHGGAPVEPIAGMVVEHYLRGSRVLFTAESPPTNPNVVY